MHIDLYINVISFCCIESVHAVPVSIRTPYISNNARRFFLSLFLFFFFWSSGKQIQQVRFTLGLLLRRKPGYRQQAHTLGATCSPLACPCWHVPNTCLNTVCGEHLWLYRVEQMSGSGIRGLTSCWLSSNRSQCSACCTKVLWSQRLRNFDNFYCRSDTCMQFQRKDKRW